MESQWDSQGDREGRERRGHKGARTKGIKQKRKGLSERKGVASSNL